MTVERKESCLERGEKIEYVIYKQRWVILLIYFIFAFTSAFQWYQYSVIMNIVSRYYSVSNASIDWLTMVFNITYVPLIFPATQFLNKKGTRYPLIVGTFFMMAGAFIKVASIQPHLFWVTMVGQTVVSISQAFALPVPPFLASIWFSSGEVTTAISISLFGTLLGIAASLALPPVMVKNHDSLDAIGDDLQVMAYWIAGASTLCFLLAVLFLQARPPTPPSPEQALKKSKFNQDPKLMHVLKNLSKNPCYLLILTSYCINQGVVNSVTALLNPLILPHFKDGENFAGRIGMTFTIVQMTGTFLCGFVLDKTCKYKLVSSVVYALSVIGMVAFTYSLKLEMEILVFMSSIFVGFFLGGYVSIACCYSLEVTYPEPEGTSGGLLTLFAMTASVLITLGYGAMIRSIGDEWANSAVTLLLIFGTVLHFFMKPEYRRQNAHNSAKVMAKQQESRSSNFERNEYNTCSEVAIPQDLRSQYTNVT